MSIISGGGPSRRRVLLGSGAVLAGAGVGEAGTCFAALPPAAVSADTAGLDRDLLALCHEFHRAYEARKTLDDEPLFAQKEVYQGWEKRNMEVTHYYFDVLDELVPVQPKTLAGLMAKAKAVSVSFRKEETDLEGNSTAETHAELALALAEDLLKFHGVQL